MPSRPSARRGSRCGYLHLSDNSSWGDEHEMPTCGTLDVKGIARQLRRIGYQGTMMLEVFYPVERLRQVIAEGGAKRLARMLWIANRQED